MKTTSGDRDDRNRGEQAAVSGTPAILTTLRDLWLLELLALREAEAHATKTFDTMGRGAVSPALRDALLESARVSGRHRETLEQLLVRTGASRGQPGDIRSLPGGEPSHAVAAILEEPRRTVGPGSGSAIVDAALIVAAQKATHYKIAAYGSARSFAGVLGDTEAHRALQECLNEEGDIDRLLTGLAEESVNVAAADAAERSSQSGAIGLRSETERLATRDEGGA